MSKSICITNGIIVTMNPGKEIIDRGTIKIEDDRITGIFGNSEWKSNGDEEIIDVRGKVVIPGMINSHMHSRPFRALGDDLPGPVWHSRYAQALSKLMDDESNYIGGLNVFAECIRGGVTCVANMPPTSMGCVRAAWEIGIRAVIFPHGGDDPKLREVNESLDVSLKNVENAGNQEGKRVQLWFGFGHPMECSKVYLKKMREYATQYKVGIQGHVAMTSREIGLYPEKFGKSIVKYFYDTGFLGKDVVLDHGIWLTPEEIRLMAETGTKLIHSPRMNMRYGSGVTPVPEMLDAGVCVGLGTDGPLSTYRIDMFEAMRLACFLQRVHKRDITALSSSQALDLMFLGGAKAIGLEKEIGSLEVGKKADITIVNFDQPHLTPLAKGRHSNINALLVFSCSALDVETVFIDGKVILKNGELQTMNEKEIITRVNDFAKKALDKIE